MLGHGQERHRASRQSSTRDEDLVGHLAEQILDEHGGALYCLGCVLTGNPALAESIVARAIAEACATLDDSTAVAGDCVRRSIAQSVFTKCRDAATGSRPSQAVDFPHPAMEWLRQVSAAQREAIALCIYGAHDYHQAADTLGRSPEDVAVLVRAGLTDITSLRGEDASSRARTGEEKR